MCDINDAIQIAVLGDKSVGKTAIIRQWLFNDFHIQYHETHMATYHFTALYNGDRLFHIRIIDTPRFDENDPDPQNEWVKLYCFRRCALFLMVFDISREETFSYIKQLYREIVSVRNGLSRSSIDDDTLTATVPIILVANKADLINLDQRYSNVTLANSREITNFAKKTLKANTIQCSAKYNWHLVLLFKEVCRMLERVEDNVGQKGLHHGRRQKHCSIS